MQHVEAPPTEPHLQPIGCIDLYDCDLTNTDEIRILVKHTHTQPLKFKVSAMSQDTKAVVLLYMNNEQSKSNVKKIILLPISSKRIVKKEKI